MLGQEKFTLLESWVKIFAHQPHQEDEGVKGIDQIWKFMIENRTIHKTRSLFFRRWIFAKTAYISVSQPVWQLMMHEISRKIRVRSEISQKLLHPSWKSKISLILVILTFLGPTKCHNHLSTLEDGNSLSIEKKSP